MILIADSGSTKTDWCLAKEGKAVKNIVTQGINPYHQDKETIGRIVTDELITALGDDVPDRIVFYGSGCREEKVGMMTELLGKAFAKAVDIEVNGDLLGAARGLLGVEEGVACILGTGSNSCLYDGKGIVENISPLGYILGDEGSGAVLGKMFLNEVIKNKSLEEVKNDFFKTFGMTEGDIVERVYRQPQANRFLASLAPFVAKYLDRKEVREVVADNFSQFFRKNVNRYGRRDLPVGFVGSIAWHFRSVLEESAEEEGLRLGRVEKSPMEGLLRYHFR